jgi:hypothetical protein
LRRPTLNLGRLEPLVGAWEAEDQTLDGVFGPGVSVRSSEAFHWLDGGYFLVRRYKTTLGDEPTQKGVNYWFYDAEAALFRIIFFSNNGNFSEEGNRYAGGVSDGALTLEGPARFRYGLDDAGKIGVDQDGTILISWWLRTMPGCGSPG